MDLNGDGTSEDLSVLGQMNGNSAIDHSGQLAQCALCHRILSSDDWAGDSEAVSFCGDCKFLIMEDLGTPIQSRRRTHRLRRRRSRSSNSMNFFSQQISYMITQVRQNQTALLEPENNQSVDGDSATSVFQRSSSRTTPSRSRRWRGVLSDSESDAFDSLYGDSESNASFSGSRIFAGESDTISYSAYGGDSDASVDGHSFLETENDVYLGGLSDPETDTDIDPMNAGLSHWNSDDLEEDNEDGENFEWEETDVEENTVASLVRGQLYLNFDLSERNISSDQRQILSPEFGNTRRYLTFQERIQRHIADFERTETQNYIGHPSDHLGARAFDELLEHLAETESSRRGAPPAAVSFIKNLPRIVIQEDREKLDDLTCAICKDHLSSGTIVNQLPCLHIYHPSCILPWLTTRNSCPLCRLELPTDDQDYEDRKNGTANILNVQEIQQGHVDEDGSSYLTDGAEAEVGLDWFDYVELDNPENPGRESATRRWLYFVAPVVGVVGIALALCLGNPMTHIRWSNSNNNCSPGLCVNINPSIPRNNGQNRRWWFPF